MFLLTPCVSSLTLFVIYIVVTGLSATFNLLQEQVIAWRKSGSVKDGLGVGVGRDLF